MKTFYAPVIDADFEHIAGEYGKFRIIGEEKIIYEGHSFGFNRTCLYRVSTPKGLPKETVTRTLSLYFSYFCSHDHDCCGCINQYAGDIRYTGKRREYFVEVRQVQNV